MSSVAVQVADAIAAELNARPALWAPQSFTAVRAWLPVTQLEKFSGLQVTATPNAIVLGELRARDKRREYHYRRDVVIQAKVADAGNASCDPFSLLAEQIGDHFAGLTLPAYAGPGGAAVVTSALVDPECYHEWLDAYRVFATVVQMTVLLVRP